MSPAKQAVSGIPKQTRYAEEKNSLPTFARSSQAGKEKHASVAIGSISQKVVSWFGRFVAATKHEYSGSEHENNVKNSEEWAIPALNCSQWPQGRIVTKYAAVAVLSDPQTRFSAVCKKHTNG